VTIDQYPLCSFVSLQAGTSISIVSKYISMYLPPLCTPFSTTTSEKLLITQT